jgi:hypothetical protein
MDQPREETLAELADAVFLPLQGVESRVSWLSRRYSGNSRVALRNGGS